jgi:hypothetical protein
MGCGLFHNLFSLPLLYSNYRASRGQVVALILPFQHVALESLPFALVKVTTDVFTDDLNVCFVVT